MNIALKPAVLKSALLGGILAFGLPSVAMAQSSGGNIVGEATVGETVIVKGAETGFHREIQIKKDGKYKLRRVPTGTYTVEVLDKDGNNEMTRSVTVRVGSTARVQK